MRPLATNSAQSVGLLDICVIASAIAWALVGSTSSAASPATSGMDVQLEVITGTSASNASIMNGVVASLISIGGVVVAELVPSFTDAFDLFFHLSWITLLLGYTPMFLAFLKLRRTDGAAERPYKVPGGKVMTFLFGIVPFVLLVAGIIFTIFGDFTKEYIVDSLPLIYGVVASLIVQEILVARIPKENK